MKLSNVIPLGYDYRQSYDVDISDDSGTIVSVTPTTHPPNSSPRPVPSLLLPSLCHPHIHLDKPYLLTSHTSHNHTAGNRTDTSTSTSQDRDKNSPADRNVDYSDLSLVTGTFTEALTHTSAAKTRYTPSDLFNRGAQLIAESLACGVTSLRAFVELDHVTNRACLDAGLALKHHFAAHCHIQLCAFAQDPVFNTDKHGEANRAVIEQALSSNNAELVSSDGIEVLGSTPYVEGSPALQRKNIDWAIDLAMKYTLHVDFHLDYNLDPHSEPMIWHVVETLKQKRWTERMPASKTVVVGHCSRLTLFSEEEWTRLAREIREHDLPIHFVGLPTSDLFMMGRRETESGGDKKGASSDNNESNESSNTTGENSGSSSNDRNDTNNSDPNTKIPFSTPRGTLPLPTLIRSYSLPSALGINNVGNAFTPWGSVDPLRLASLGVGVYQAGTREDARLLFECVSDRARKAIGLIHEGHRGEGGMIGRQAPFLVICNDTREIGIEVQGPETETGTEIETETETGTVTKTETKTKAETDHNKTDKDQNTSETNAIKTRRLDRQWKIQKKMLGVYTRPHLAVEDVIWDPPAIETRRIIAFS